MAIAESDSAASVGKNALREQVMAARAARTSQSRAAARAAIRGSVTGWCRAALEPGSVIAAYVPLSSEPLPPELLGELASAGHRLLVPVTLSDNDLDWQDWNDGATLGREAIGAASLVLTPAFAVDPLGRRLGRGGGSYDRALSRTSRGAVIAAVVYDDELVDEVPTASWDVPVTAVFSPSGFETRPVTA